MENSTQSQTVDNVHINRAVNSVPLQDAVIAVFKTHEEVDAAIQQFIRAGLDIKHFSVVGKGYHSEETIMGFYNAMDRIKIWGKYGAFWGGLWGLLMGGAFILIPVFGSLVILGPFASMVLSAVEGAIVTGSFSALGAALFSIGIPKDSVLKYEEAIQSNGFLIMAHGGAEEMALAKNIIHESHATHVDSFENVKYPKLN